MAKAAQAEVKYPFLDKTEIRRIVTEQNALRGFVPNPTATAEKARAMAVVCLKAQGLRPEDDSGSHGIISAREE